MAIQVLRRNGNLEIGLAKAHNMLVASLVGAAFHADKTAVPLISEGLMTASVPTPLVVTAANAAGDITTAITLLNNVFTTLATHWLDGASVPLFGGLPSVAAGAHKIPDATNLATMAAVFAPVSPLSSPNGSVYVATNNLVTDTAAVVARANQVKASYNVHLSQAGVHYNNDGSNSVATANATDLPTSTTLLNAIKAAVNAHLASGPAGGGYMVNVIL